LHLEQCRHVKSAMRYRTIWKMHFVEAKVGSNHSKCINSNLWKPSLLRVETGLLRLGSNLLTTLPILAKLPH
jgi:hypothetical protein